MKYSIIIPTLNEEKLLPGLLKQVSEQSLRRKFDIEIIISDGGSKDKTIEIAKKYADTVTLHNKPHRQNIAEGRNEGAFVASGDVFIFINADIIFLDTVAFFEFLEKNFEKDKYRALTCSVKVFPEEEILLDKIYHNCYNGYFKFLNTLGVGMGRGECQVVWKDIFLQVSGYNKELAAGEDFDLFRRIRKLGDILFTNDICVYESPRRYRKLGYSGVTWSWIKNGFSVFLKNKSISKEWEAVR